ncbi:MAG: S-layer homology domain-containing protein [Actinobacteria bacterium]|nr:S-layer homology domain-containing protein [Actinomycetota bacterium]
MRIKRAGITLLVAGMASLAFTGVAIAGPIGGAMPGSGMGSGLGVTAGTTMMQPGTGTTGGSTTPTNMMQLGTTRPGTGTTMMQPGTGTATGMGPGSGMSYSSGSGAGTGAVPGPGHMFMDVMSSDWFAGYAQNMASHGFMNGFADGTFGPQQPITRGQFSAILGRMMDLQPQTGTSFTDTQDYWAAGMIETMARMGIVAGHADGSFGPNGLITREQMATFMDRAWQAINGNAAAADMVSAMNQMMQAVHDVSGNWAATHIANMMQLGVFQGSNGMFHPTDTATRAQAAAVMWRWFEAWQAQK